MKETKDDPIDIDRDFRALGSACRSGRRLSVAAGAASQEVVCLVVSGAVDLDAATMHQGVYQGALTRGHANRPVSFITGSIGSCLPADLHKAFDIIQNEQTALFLEEF